MDGATPIECANCTAMGISTTTTGVLFMKADASTVNPAIAASTRTGCFAPCREISRVMLASAPVRTSPPDRMNIAAIVQGAGLENTVSTSSNGRRPVAIRTTAPAIAVTSGG